MHPVVSYRGHFRYKQARGDAVPGYRHCIDGHMVARAKEKWVGIPRIVGWRPTRLCTLP